MTIRRFDLAHLTLIFLLTGVAVTPPAYSAKAPVARSALSVMTLNLAHGRGSGRNQLLQSTQSITANLVQVVDLLKRIDADVVALQEADGVSFWSGNFNHVGYLAENAGYPEHRLAVNVQGRHFAYGTGFLSRYQILQTVKHTFSPSPPTLTKGFLLSSIRGPLGQDVVIDVVSVHLDFSRAGVRERQIDEMIQIMGKRSRPTIVLGDFNSEWPGKASAVRDLAKEYQMRPWQPDRDDLGTYSEGRKRLDWILISDELDFLDYQVLPDVVSDHQAVFARIALKN
jgi:endonuclease/exonuclease/phosphatase family metal-dependent hydrolase